MDFRKTLLTLFLITGITFQNCSDCDCCFGPVEDFFDIQDIIIDHYGNDGNILEIDAVDFEEYGFLSLFMEVEYVACHKTKNWNLSLMNSAYGCSPPIAGALGSKEESIENLQIITLNDYDDDHKTGDSIKDLLEITNENKNELVALNDFLTDLGNVPQNWFRLKLISKPSLNQNFQVKINLDLSTGEKYEAFSKKVTFE